MKAEKPRIRWVKDGKGNLMGVGKVEDVMTEKPDSGKGETERIIVVIY